MEAAESKTRMTVDRLATFLALLALLWLAALTVVVVDRNTPVFVSVSLRSLLERHVERMSDGDYSTEELQRRSDAYVMAVERVVADLSAERDVIVLVSEAVVSSNVVDLTGDVARLADEIAREGTTDGE